MLANLSSVPFVFSMTHWVKHPVCYRHCKTVFKMAAGKKQGVQIVFHTFSALISGYLQKWGWEDGLKILCLCVQVLPLKVWAQLMQSCCFPHMSNGWNCGSLSFPLSKSNCFPCAGTHCLASSLQPFIQLSPVTGMFGTNTDERKYETPC